MCAVLLPPGVKPIAVKYIYIYIISYVIFFGQRGLWPPVALQPSAGYDLLVSRVSLITHNVAPQSVGILWTCDQLVAETST
jgi:hypothetical protein